MAQWMLWKKVGNATGCKAGHGISRQVSKQFSVETCDIVVVNFLTAMDVGKFLLG